MSFSKSHDRATIWLELFRRIIGVFDEAPDSYNISNPYNFRSIPCDDLAKGLGTPPGFKRMVFYVELDLEDPRMTTDSLTRIAGRMNEHIRKWLHKETEVGSNKIACKTPTVEVATSTQSYTDKSFTIISVSVYVYDKLEPEIKLASTT